MLVPVHSHQNLQYNRVWPVMHISHFSFVLLSSTVLARPQAAPAKGAGGFTGTLASLGNLLKGPEAQVDPKNIFGIGVPGGGLGSAGNSTFATSLTKLGSWLLGDKSIIQAVGGDGDLNTIICRTFNSTGTLGKLLNSGFGGPTEGSSPGETCGSDLSGGTGPYKANWTGDASLLDHSIYVPLIPPPADVKMPVIIWGNGACLNIGNMFANFLTEIASHGFMIIANGPANGTFNGMTTADNLRASIDWVTTNPAAKKYGNVDVR
jgi:hypothetical protein